jgi:magnesium transporter
MITVQVHPDGTGFQTGLSLDRISDVLDDKGAVLWVDIVDPTEDEVRLIGEEFGFHPLAMEDATQRHQRPKVDVYDGFLFIVFFALELGDGRPQARELALFAGKNYLVTVHAGPLPAIAETAQRWREHAAQRRDRGVGLLVASLLDAIVDGYFPVVDAISERVDGLEGKIFAHVDRGAQEEIFVLKKDLLAVRHVVAPERDVMNVFVRPESPLFGAETVDSFEDVSDHILRVTDTIDTYRDLLSGCLNAFLAVAANRLDQTVKTLTASAIILTSMTLIAGVYGMNFVHLPELNWRLGYAWALGLMAAVGGGFLLTFRRMDWL